EDSSQLALSGTAEDLFSYRRDIEYPGYGHVDDNGNIMLAALDGIDNDGDGLIDEGLRLPDLADPLFPEYYNQLGIFEGVDEPGELQRYRPLPNLQAESRNRFSISGNLDIDDNDNDGALNERGE